MSVLWSPDLSRGAPMRRWFDQVGATDYEQAHSASIGDPGAFWEWAWRECAVAGESGPTAMVGEGVESARFFPDASLNIVDTLLAGPAEDEVLVGVAEDGSRTRWTRGQLRADVAAVAAAMRDHGVHVGDRVAAWTPNVPQTVVWALAALSIGAVVSTASPDFAAPGVVDRFGQIEPVLLLVGSTYAYGGREFDMRPEIVRALAELPSLRHVVVLGEPGESGESWPVEATPWRSWIDRGGSTRLHTVPVPFDHPGFILFSSGTTGAPKCIVHSAAGVLLKDLVEQRLHLDIEPGDRVCYFTTCGWMMWNWLVMVLGTGATVVLFDGQPMYPAQDRLLRLVDEERLTFLGVSAKYIETLREKGVNTEGVDLSSLKTIASTGSPLVPELFDYVYEAIDPRVHLASISGGTDICGCFVLGIPTEPVRRGEIQGPALGLDVRVFDESGNDVGAGDRGELVCATPFPSRPRGFWGDDGSRLHESYFARFPGVWAHGDFISRTSAGGFVIHGRSDATLNSGGIRIGTAEIYRIVDAMPQISESIVVGQRTGTDTRIVLFVVTASGVDLDDDLRGAIKAELRGKASPRHVPAQIIEVPAVPRTVTGKLAELAVTDIVNGDPVRSTGGLADPSTLEAFQRWANS